MTSPSAVLRRSSPDTLPSPETEPAVDRVGTFANPILMAPTPTPRISRPFKAVLAATADSRVSKLTKGIRCQLYPAINEPEHLLKPHCLFVNTRADSTAPKGAKIVSKVADVVSLGMLPIHSALEGVVSVLLSLSLASEVSLAPMLERLV